MSLVVLFVKTREKLHGYSEKWQRTLKKNRSECFVSTRLNIPCSALAAPFFGRREVAWYRNFARWRTFRECGGIGGRIIQKSKKRCLLALIESIKHKYVLNLEEDFYFTYIIIFLKIFAKLGEQLIHGRASGRQRNRPSSCTPHMVTFFLSGQCVCTSMYVCKNVTCHDILQSVSQSVIPLARSLLILLFPCPSDEMYRFSFFFLPFFSFFSRVCLFVDRLSVCLSACLSSIVAAFHPRIASWLSYALPSQTKRKKKKKILA